ncbi:type II secretion system protein [Geothrix sp. 21YS21S-4]|uniref:type II secretion system protein n=1 Tax=Geothrix sp. 21YS21S-4 TaxID=3068889 RepID=UPI0027BAAEA2|nr:type II secretion system protein [Geothrix sp. 21YS21S-4]
MPNQKGFTLIELLLVLAIIGIISAIAIPALLGQRSRARDRSCQENASSILSDIISAADKYREQTGAVQTLSVLNTNVFGTSTATSMIPTIYQAKNPWNTSGAVGAYATSAISETSSDGTATKAAATVAKLGQVQFGWLSPSGATPATLVSAVYLQNQFKDGSGASTNVFLKTSNLD